MPLFKQVAFLRESTRNFFFGLKKVFGWELFCMSVPRRCSIGYLYKPEMSKIMT